jgi:hypothetical protein
MDAAVGISCQAYCVAMVTVVTPIVIFFLNQRKFM